MHDLRGRPKSAVTSAVRQDARMAWSNAFGAISTSDLAVCDRSAVCFHISTLPAKMVFQLAAHGLERVSDRHVGVFMAVMRVGCTANHQVLARHAELDPDPEELPLMVVAVGRLHHDATADDAVEDAFQLGEALANVRLEGGLGGNW
jgi:hypothetical protein